MPNIKKTVGENIKRLRQHKNITGLELAEAMSISQSTVSDWENGKKLPRAGTIERLAEYFDVSKSDILSDMSETDRAGLPDARDIIDLAALLQSPIRVVLGEKLLTSSEKLLLLRIANATLGNDKS
jgi:repressor LexA